MVAVAKDAWTIGFWHEDWNLNSMKKSQKLGSPHYLMPARLSSKRWGMVLHRCQRRGGPKPHRATNCPSACLHSLEMVTGQTAHFPWNGTKLGGACHMWQRRRGQNSHGNTTPHQSQGPASPARVAGFPWVVSGPALSFFFYFIFSNWSIVNLQYSVSFRYTAKWFSYTHTHTRTHTRVYSFSDSFPL